MVILDSVSGFGMMFLHHNNTWNGVFFVCRIYLWRREFEQMVNNKMLFFYLGFMYILFKLYVYHGNKSN